MYSCNKILRKIENGNTRRDIRLFNRIIREYLKEINEKFKFHNCGNPFCKFDSLKFQFVYDSPYIKEFYLILQKYGYNMANELQDAIHYLTCLDKPWENSEIIKKFLHSPFIQDISCSNDNKFSIFSEQYGTVKFTSASSYFKDNPIISEYIKSETLLGRCHDNAYFLASELVNNYSVTSLCRGYFDRSYHHSYSYDPDENTIIDLCHNAVIDKDGYYRIFSPLEVSKVLNSDISKELDKACESSVQPSSRCFLLIIALYKEYLEKIGYEGTFEDAPKTYLKQISRY